MSRIDLEKILIEEFKKQLGNVWTEQMNNILLNLEKSRQN